jgi:hypothetical protein
MNVPLLAPAATVTLAGTVSMPVLLESATVPVLDITLFSVTVHAELWPVPNELGTQLTPVSCVGATIPNESVFKMLFAAAVIVAV